uniref:Probetacellulin n=1 Tax=Sus scrofa TaxID=9823 RepID=A0A4X1T1J6_PIG
MAGANPGSGASSLPLLLALALGKWQRWLPETQEESLGWSRREGETLASGPEGALRLAGTGLRTWTRQLKVKDLAVGHLGLHLLPRPWSRGWGAALGWKGSCGQAQSPGPGAGHRCPRALGRGTRERGVVAGKSTKAGAWDKREDIPWEEEERELLGLGCSARWKEICLDMLPEVLRDPFTERLLFATTTPPKRRGHFSRCPKQYKHYCIKGRCRFVVAEQTPSCVCDEGYAGARCERVDLFYLRGDRGQILVICLIAVMVIFIILVIGVCTCCHPLRKHRKRRKVEEEMETLGKDITPINEDIQETSIA